ncbi:nitrate reductase molybdenum cofactor assembly chaperone [Salmonella enterica]|nr:nitrate reductase molybdenum cofactor assembly chaperone [Salmonella enterica]
METTTKKARSLYIPYAGPVLLEFPLLNKGSAFSVEERRNFNLSGLLPEVVESIEEQAERAWLQYQGFKTEIDKHIYLRNIQDTNETLFYRLVQNHLEEMMPVIYTPTVGAACERFSEIYRRARGVFISYPNRHNMDDILQNVPNHNIKVIVVTDGERILGLGDQGIGGMGIPIGKLSLYTACGGISPAYTLPVVLDVGTNNQQLLNDPLYMGWRHPRITDDEYYAFVDEFIQAVKQRWPDILLQFEDFAQKNAMPLLTRYRDEICSFNDDIQGTAAVTVGKAIGLLMEYPDDELWECRDEALVLIQHDAPMLVDFTRELLYAPLLDKQAEWCEVFDRGRATSLLLFEHVHAESRDRGQAMVDLLSQYETVGLQLNCRELPDHLPLYLEYLSVLPEAEAREGLQNIAPILALLGGRLKQRGAPWYQLFDALLTLAGSTLTSDSVTKQIVQESRDDTRQALDAVWEEEQVKFIEDNATTCDSSPLHHYQRRFSQDAAPQYVDVSAGGPK